MDEWLPPATQHSPGMHVVFDRVGGWLGRVAQRKRHASCRVDGAIRSDNEGLQPGQPRATSSRVLARIRCDSRPGSLAYELQSVSSILLIIQT